MSDDAKELQSDVVQEARAYANGGWCPPRASELITRLRDEVEKYKELFKAEREARNADAQAAAVEARWQERQGEDYGSY